MKMVDREFIEWTHAVAKAPDRYGLADLKDFTAFLHGMNYVQFHRDGSELFSMHFQNWMRHRHQFPSEIHWTFVIREKWPNDQTGIVKLAEEIEEYHRATNGGEA